MKNVMPRDESVNSPSTIDVRPLSIHTGAEIGGVDLTRPLNEGEVRDIRAALLQWKVVFFRDQILDHDQHVAFGRQFGELTVGHAVYGHVDDHPEIYSIHKHRAKSRFSGETMVTPWSGWHTDITAAHNPPAASILRGVVVPTYGGDTQFTNLVAAYNGLSETMRGIVDGLRGIHRFAVPAGAKSSEKNEQLLRDRLLVSEHPIVRVHPETGERVLFVSPSFLKSIVGFSPRESQKFLELMWEHSIRPEYTVRFKWEPGSIAFWDNRATSHLPPVDIFASDFDRQFFRITLVGDVPVGVDGSPSTAIEGDQILAV